MTLADYPWRAGRVRCHAIVTSDGNVEYLWLSDDQELCQVCKGRGQWDSCFDCGNRGWMQTS